MATITIGGKVVSIPVLTFKRIKRIWPIVSKLEGADFLNETDVDKMMEMMGEAIAVLAIAINDKDKDADWIEENLTAAEMPQLQSAMVEMLIDSGLASRTPEGAELGEAMVAGGSTETGTLTSQPLSPPDALPPTGA